MKNCNNSFLIIVRPGKKSQLASCNCFSRFCRGREDFISYSMRFTKIENNYLVNTYCSAGTGFRAREAMKSLSVLSNFIDFSLTQKVETLFFYMV